jgi:hypothetical protein
MVEEPAAMMPHLGALVMQPFADGRKRVKTGAEQRAISLACVMRDRKLADEDRVAAVVAHRGFLHWLPGVDHRLSSSRVARCSTIICYA